MQRRLFIDVRDSEEFATDHVEGAIHVPPHDLMRGAPQLQDVPRDTELVLYCKSGARSNAAMSYFRQLGFENLTNGINKDHIRAKYF